MGTNGEIRGAMEKDEIEVVNFSTGAKNVINLKESFDGHGGGDSGIIYDFVRLLQNDNKESITSISKSVHSHVLAFAAEKSRLEKKVINIDEQLKTQSGKC